jgi:hypothetical protein
MRSLQLVCHASGHCSERQQRCPDVCRLSRPQLIMKPVLSGLTKVLDHPAWRGNEQTGHSLPKDPAALNRYPSPRLLLFRLGTEPGHFPIPPVL